MATKTYNRGTTKTWGVTYDNTNGVAGVTLLFTVKTDVDESVTDATALFEQDFPITAGAATIEMTPSSVAVTWDEGDYVYDVKVIDADSKIYLLEEGKFKLNVSATNRTS